MTHPVLSFFDLLDDTNPERLSWSKASVAVSTILAAVTGFATAVQGVIGDAAHTEWGAFASAIGLHAISHGARAVVRHQQSDS
jgi:hypothetical protein